MMGASAAAAEAELKDRGRPSPIQVFKIELARRVIVSTLAELAGLEEARP